MKTNTETYDALHTDECPFCYNMSCNCHENQEKIDALEQMRQDGLVSDQDCDNIFRGRTI